MTGTVSLLIDGVVFEGWISAEIKRSIEHGAQSFSLGVVERWAGQPDRRTIRPGAACEVQADGETVIRGYVDDTRIDYDSGSHRVTVTGRCKIGDLFDCAAVVDGPHEWSGVGLAEIARRICDPFGVQVIAQAPLGTPWTRFAIQPGETAWNAINDAARERAVLAVGDGLGNLVLTRAGAGGPASTALRLGNTIVSASAAFSHKDRYSTVVARAQAEGKPGSTAADVARQQARVVDRSIARYRPKVVIESQGDGVTLGDLARWEMQVAAGRSRRVTYRVQGWRDGSRLWRPNTLVRVSDAYLDFDDDLLVVGVTLSIDATSRRTELECAPPSAFALMKQAAVKPAANANKQPGVLFETGQVYRQKPDGTFEKVPK